MTTNNEMAEQPMTTYREISAAIEAIKRGETMLRAESPKAALALAVDLGEIGYDCALEDAVIRVRGYNTTDETGRVVRISLAP